MRQLSTERSNLPSYLLIFFVSNSLLLVSGEISIQVPAKIDPAADAETIYNAFREIGTDESTLKKLLTKRSCDQRLRIGWTYEDTYGNVAKSIREDTSGSYQILLLSLFTCDTALYALHLNEAFSGGTDNESVAEILITCSESAEIRDSLVYEYYQMHWTKLEKDIRAETEGDFYNFIIQLLKKTRKPSQNTDEAKAAETAKNLVEEMPNWNDIRLHLDATLMEESPGQACLVFNEFENLANIEIEKAIDDHFDGNKRMGYRQLVHYLRDRQDFFVTRLWDSFPSRHRMNTNELTLMRIILIESEKNLLQMRKAFKAKYGVSLRQKIKKHTDGDFRDLLIPFLGTSRSK